MISNLEKILEDSFLDYSAYVIQRRAIPDARDMLKYTARQILHAQSREKLDHKHPFKKAQKSTAAATSFSYVHGGTSAYGQIIRMGRPLVQRYFLETINGNGGTPMNSSDYSAERYTEARLSELCGELFRFIDAGTIHADDWEPTYDEEGVFPKVLPSVGYYNICNGSFGSIAPTLISSIPQFNLREVNEAICCLIKDPDFDPILNPDFASGGLLLNPKTTQASLKAGEGKSALIRGKLRMNVKEGFLEVIELPYGVYTNTVCLELDKALDKSEAPFTEFKDLSKRSVQLRIYGKDLAKIEAWLYKNTSIQKHFTIKMIMLDKGKVPKLFSIKNALLAHIEHASGVFRKQYEHQLQMLQERQEVIEGLQKAYSILDDVIATIKSSNGRPDAIRLLISTYSFSTKQAEAIVDLRLHRLSAIDVQALANELESNLDSQAQIQETLDVKEIFNMQLVSLYEATAKKFGDNRRTEICQSEAWETCQDGGKADKDFLLTKCDEGYSAIYINDAEVRGLVSDMRVSIEDELIIVTNQVRGFIRKGADFIIGDSSSWADLIKLNKDEQVLFVIRAADFAQFAFLELTDSTDTTWSIHNSFVTTGASIRGKKLVNGKYQITKFSFAENATTFPKMK